jgi:hypothetical protein
MEVSMSRFNRIAVLVGCALFVLSCILIDHANAQFNQQGNKLVGAGAVGNAAQGSGVSLSADGNTAIVGGALDSGRVGAAWVYTRIGGVWSQQGDKLVGTGAVGNAAQGWYVALSADGNTAIVGGALDNDSTGAAWVFTRTSSVWSQQGTKLVGNGAVGRAWQGWSVSLSDDGNTAIVGGPFDNGEAGAAWVYTRDGGVWSQQGSKLVGTGAVGGARQGVSVSLSADGNTAVVGGPVDNGEAGAVWVFTRSENTWTQQGSKLVGNDAVGSAWQGQSVALSNDGNTAIVGGLLDSTNGATWVFTRSGSTWSQQGTKLVGADTLAPGSQGSQGVFVSLSADGNTALIGGCIVNYYNALGGAWVFTRSGDSWSQLGHKLVGTGAVGMAAQGWSVALAGDGNTAIVGGPGDNGQAGAAWMYTRAAYPLIFISDNGGRSDSLEFGTAPGATDGIDLLLGEWELPPVPPLSAFDARWQITGTQGAKRDIRDTLGGTRTRVTYTGLMQPGSGGYPFYLRWKGQELPKGTLTLRYGSDSVNMKQQDSLVIANSDVVSFRIVHDRRTTLYDTAQQGWNIVSLPLAVADRRKTSVFPVSASNAFAYTQLGYVRRDTLDYGLGYWLKFSAVQPLSVLGDPQNLDTIDVDAGWNLIGSISSPVATGSVVQIPNGIVASQYYGYNGTMYTVPSTIDPFHGYWVKANQQGKLVLSGTGFLLGKTPANRSDVISEAAHLRLIDQFGNSQEVLFTSNDVSNPDYYELPPPPPAGIFDARFSTNRMLEAVKEGESKTIPIRVSYAQYPLTISWDMKDQSLKASFVVGAKEVAMNGIGSVKVADANTSLALRLGGNSSVPKEFALSQNYPNPFNPSTTIRYDLPVDTRVTLKLFNMLGQEVLTLVSEEQKAGYKSVQWNANNFASGVYFYRLQAGDFVTSKRLLFLK